MLEYINGIIYMGPSPSIKHQRISSYLQGELYLFLQEFDCEVFAAPTDVVFEKTNETKNIVVIPDLFVVCDSTHFTENEYVGVPDFIIEILSPTNQAHDLVTKLHLDMNDGVKEYWIVDPDKQRVFIYYYDDANMLQLKTVDKNQVVRSKLFQGFHVELHKLFHL